MLNGKLTTVSSLIGNISSGFVEPDLTTKNITANGTYNASSDNADGYSSVTVDVEPDLTTKNITANGTYNASSDNVDGYSSVIVNVPITSGTTIPTKDYSTNALKYCDLTDCHGNLTIIYGCIDLGSLTWTYNTSTATPLFSAPILTNMPTSNDNCLLAGYTPYLGFWNSANNDKCVAIGGSNINISNFNYTNANDFKNAMSGVYLIYLLRTSVIITI